MSQKNAKTLRRASIYLALMRVTECEQEEGKRMPQRSKVVSALSDKIYKSLKARVARSSHKEQGEVLSKLRRIVELGNRAAA